MRKTFIISASLFCLTLLILGVYGIAFRNDKNNPVVDAKKQADAKRAAEDRIASNAGSSAVSRVTDAASYGSAILDDSHVAYFNQRSLKRATLGGGGEETLITGLPGKIMDAVWAPDRDRVLVLFDSGSAQQWYLLTLSDKTTKPLKPGISSPVWSNLSESIYYIYTDARNGKSELDTARPDGTEWKKVAVLPILNPSVSTVPSSALLSFWNKASAFDPTTLYTVPMSGEIPKVIFSGKYGADYLWSPDGTKLLVSNTLSKGGTDIRLGIANADGGEFHSVQAPTLVSKTVWSKDSKTVFYALPLSIPDNAVLPNDYYSRPIHTQDTFWKMDAASGKSERIVDPAEIGGNYDSTDLFLDRGEEYLYFTDRTSGQLFRIRLQK
ncbi:MAG TPA: hypothetical protein VN420_04410 [Candidatus Fimivivens sp.]|nr:hypothetical protein [Candidatus Fimivivens sp.]